MTSMPQRAKPPISAFVRFASVYRQFEDVNEFLNELRGLIGTRSRKSSSP